MARFDSACGKAAGITDSSGLQVGWILARFALERKPDCCWNTRPISHLAGFDGKSDQLCGIPTDPAGIR
jgi:hypothetical protein